MDTVPKSLGPTSVYGAVQTSHHVQPPAVLTSVLAATMLPNHAARNEKYDKAHDNSYTIIRMASEPVVVTFQALTLTCRRHARKAGEHSNPRSGVRSCFSELIIR